MRAHARRPHALLPTGRRLKTVGATAGLGQQCWAAAGPPGRLGGWPGCLLSLSLLFVSVFLFSATVLQIKY